jgi:hypothetical protein
MWLCLNVEFHTVPPDIGWKWNATLWFANLGLTIIFARVEHDHLFDASLVDHDVPIEIDIWGYSVHHIFRQTTMCQLKLTRITRVCVYIYNYLYICYILVISGDEYAYVYTYELGGVYIYI